MGGWECAPTDYPWACAFAISSFTCPSTVLGWGRDGHAGARSLVRYMTFCFYSDSWGAYGNGVISFTFLFPSGGWSCWSCHHGFSNFWLTKIPSDLLCPVLLILPHFAPSYPIQCLGCGWECGLWGGWIVCILFTFSLSFLNLAMRCIFTNLFSFL